MSTFPPAGRDPVNLRFWRLFAPSGKTVRLAMVFGAAVTVSWLFLHYGHGELIEKVLLVTTGGVAGGGGVLGYQRMNKLAPPDASKQ